MVVTVEIPASSQALIDRHGRTAAQATAALAAGIGAAVSTGGSVIAEALLRGTLGLTPQHGGMGLAGSIMGWMIDESIPLGAVGVPANTPAARYAAILNYGGTIRPKTARRLAIPISPEARQHTSPRDMAGLELLPRKGEPPLLVRMLDRAKKRFTAHWVLKSSVRIDPFYWFDAGVALAVPEMMQALASRLAELAAEWNAT